MTIKTFVEFNDLSQHTFDNSKVELVDDQIKLKSQVKPSELLFFNFNEDGSLDAKRSDYKLELPDFNSANQNTGTIENGKLNLIQNDYSYGYIRNITGITDKLTLSGKIYAGFTSLSSSINAIQLNSKVDSSRLVCILTNQGGGVTRVNVQVYNQVGANTYSSIVLSQAFQVGDGFEYAVTMDASEIKFYINGVLKASAVNPGIDMSTCDIQFGGPYQMRSICSYDDIQLFNDVVITEDYESPTLEPTLYSKDEQVVVTNIPFLMDEFISYDQDFLVPDNTIVKMITMLNTVKVYHDGNNWVESNGTLDNSNTVAEFNANLETYKLEKGIGGYVQIIHILKSEDGYTTPILERFNMVSTFSFKPNEIYTCIVYGRVVDNSGNPVAGAEVIISSKDYLYDNCHVFPDSKTITNENGEYSIKAVETESTGRTVDIKIKYTGLDGEEVENEFKRRVIPMFPNSKFKSLEIDE